MANTSATGGYLPPDGTLLPAEDDDLDAIFQKAIAGITGLPGSMVRPRWQPVPPKQPEPSVNWCALGVTVQTPDAGPYIEHIADGDGKDRSNRHEDIEVLASFYGPAAQEYASRLRDGFGIPQNNEEINAAGVFFVDSGPIRPAPELVNQQWIRRRDIALTFRRKVSREYAVLNVQSATVTTTTETFSDEVSINAL